MKRAEIEKGLILVVDHYEAVVKRLQERKTRSRRKADRQEVLDDYVLTRNFAQTARAFGLSKNGAYLIVYKAIRIAQAIAEARKQPTAGRNAWR